LLTSNGLSSSLLIFSLSLVFLATGLRRICFVLVINANEFTASHKLKGGSEATLITDSIVASTDKACGFAQNPPLKANQ